MHSIVAAVLFMLAHRAHHTAVVFIVSDGGTVCTSVPPDKSRPWCYIIPSGDSIDHPGWNNDPSAPGLQ